MTRTLRAIYDARVARSEIARDPAQEQVVESLDRLRDGLLHPSRGVARWLRRPGAGGGLYVWGEVGRGKSMLVDAFMEAAEGVPGRRVHFHAFMQEIHGALHAARAEDAADPVAAATDRVTGGARLLALDELEIVDIVDAMIVGRVVQRLLDRGVSLVVTSNRAPADLYRDGLKRELFVPFVRLIEERLEVRHLAGGEDYRRIGADMEAAYLTPNDAAARARMDRLWAEVSRGKAEPLRLGRGGRIAQDGAGAARASFDALCEAALGPADYLGLARRLSVLLIDDVPRLTRGRHDAARRFVMLIDALYDAGARLALSAEVPPGELCTDREVSGEFARTASRLHEMCGGRWAAPEAPADAVR